MPVLEPGAGVVTSRADVHYVVTEHGIAYLHGKTLRERAEALIAIADPRFQQELEDFAVRAHYLEKKALTCCVKRLITDLSNARSGNTHEVGWMGQRVSMSEHESEKASTGNEIEACCALM